MVEILAIWNCNIQTFAIPIFNNSCTLGFICEIVLFFLLSFNTNSKLTLSQTITSTPTGIAARVCSREHNAAHSKPTCKKSKSETAMTDAHHAQFHCNCGSNSPHVFFWHWPTNCMGPLYNFWTSFVWDTITPKKCESWTSCLHVLWSELSLSGNFLPS